MKWIKKLKYVTLAVILITDGNKKNTPEIVTGQPFCQTSVIGSTYYKKKPIWLDYHLNGFKWYRKWRKTKWYKHQFTNDALQVSISFVGTWWALYGEINRYSKVVETEEWQYCH